MKKPEKKERKFYTGRKPCEYCGKVWHKCNCSKASVYNKAIKECEAYHNWDKEENYIRKEVFEKAQREIKLLKAQLRKFEKVFNNYDKNKKEK